jgi:HSP20 family protein
MSEDRRKYLKEILDEFDRYFEDFEKSVEDAIRTGFSNSQQFFSKPVVKGMALGVGPEGRPTISFFGDNTKTPDGFRSPIVEQMVDEKEGTLRLVVELPGIEKQDIQLSALEDKVSIQAEDADRKYRVEVELQREIDPESGNATYRNGLLDVVFKQRDKANKGYRRVRVV